MYKVLHISIKMSVEYVKDKGICLWESHAVSRYQHRYAHRQEADSV